jgi:hypothetical protein
LAAEDDSPGGGLPLAVALAWLAGAAVAGGVQVVRLMRVERLLARARPAPSGLQAEVDELADLLGVRAPRALVLPGLGTPFIWGCGRARLAWPEGLEDVLSAAGRRAVLVDELAHLKRRDHWVGWLLLVGGCVWWWHPLYRLVSRQAEGVCRRQGARPGPGLGRLHRGGRREGARGRRARAPGGRSNRGAPDAHHLQVERGRSPTRR